MIEGVAQLRRASRAERRAEQAELLEVDAAVSVQIGLREHQRDLLLARRLDAEPVEEELELVARDLAVAVAVDELEDLAVGGEEGRGRGGGGEDAFGGILEVDGGVGGGAGAGAEGGGVGSVDGAGARARLLGAGAAEKGWDEFHGRVTQMQMQMQMRNGGRKEEGGEE